MVYKQTTGYTCGPSAYIGLFEGSGSQELELRIHEQGRIFPSRIFLGVSFLQVNPSLFLYTQDTKVHSGIIALVFNPKVEDFEKKFVSYYKSLISEHKKHIKIIRKSIDSVISILDQAVKYRKRAILLTHSSNWVPEGNLHWVYLLGRTDKELYLFGDPLTGKVLEFNEKQIKEQLITVINSDFPLQIVTDFEAVH